MAERRIIVNCGASHVSYSVFSTKGGGLVLEDLKIETLNYDYSDEAGWATALTQSLAAILTTAKHKGDVELIAPGYQLLTKSIKIPSVEPEKRSQIIAFEAQQNIPYPLLEVVWGHQVIADDGIESDVILIACKKDAANAFCNSVSQTGLKPVSVQSPALLDYNAFKYAYGVEGTTLLINMGARSSSFLFISPEGLFVREIKLGGNSLSQTIADGIGQPFAQAEQIKTDYFNGALELAEDDTTYQIISQSADNFMRRIGQDITRSIVNYKRQKGGEAPMQILLAGRGSLLPGLVEYLTEAQGVYVDYFDPTQSMTLGGGVSQDYLYSQYFQLSEVLGLACRDLLPDSGGVELLPQHIASDQAFEKQKKIFAIAALCLPLAPIPGIAASLIQTSLYNSAAEELKRGVQPLNMLNDEIEVTRAEAEAVNGMILKFEEIVKSKPNWINFFTDLQDRLFDIKDVWIDKLEVIRTVEEKEEKEDRRSSSRSRRGRDDEEEKKEVKLEPDSYVLMMTGRMLLRVEGTNIIGLDKTVASSRLESFKSSLEESEFVKEVKTESLNPTDRVLEFTLKLTIDSETPL